MKFFRTHQARWARGEIRLTDFCQGRFTRQDGALRRLWYPAPLGHKVIPDKAEVFEMLGYRPSDPSCRAHSALAKVRVYSGGARSGKSLWAGREILPVLLSPNTRTWIVAPEYETGLKEFEYVLHAVETDEIQKSWGLMLKSGRIRNSPKNGDMEIRLGWGDAGESFVKVKSAERKRSLLAEELDMACIVEASQIPEIIWSRYLRVRLITRKGVAIFPSSPDGTGWYNNLFLAGLRGDPGHWSINADTRMNPTIDLDEILFWTDPRHMSDEDFEEQIRGKPTPKYGRVYRGFDRGIHSKNWREDWPKSTWDRGRAFDFGYRNPYVVLWIAQSGEAFYVYREFYKTHQLTDDVIRFIAQAEGWPIQEDEHAHVHLEGESGRLEAMTLASVADWDAAERADLARRGLRTRKAKKEILPGVRTVAEHLRVQEDGRPRLYISPRCPKLLQEFESYQWGAHGKPKEEDDHGMDALRYFLHTLAPRHRRDMEVKVLA